MKWRRISFFAVFLFLLFSQVYNGTVLAGESPEQKTTKKKPKGRVYREKEAEGTQAPNRFESDVTVKSRYELNGQPLEVDTD